jgi:Protein of unknown function (DUF2637)
MCLPVHEPARTVSCTDTHAAVKRASLGATLCRSSVNYGRFIGWSECSEKPMRPGWSVRTREPVMSGPADTWIRRTTTGCVALLALIAATVSYLHMHMPVELHGQPGWVGALTPFSADGMIVAASTTLLADSRSGGRGGFLPWALLVIGSIASLAANVAVAEPTATGRVIAAWPSFALIAAYEMLMRQVRHNATRMGALRQPSNLQRDRGPASGQMASAEEGDTGRDLQRRAWQWAEANRCGDGSLPSGKAIACQFNRHERWGRLVKRSGCAGEFGFRLESREPDSSAHRAA